MGTVTEMDETLSMVVVMGVTGAGKSYLINKLAGKQVAKEGATLDPCRQHSSFSLI